eukprot:Nk52_evm60s485 gene=Nk52_evmTU60s485
MKEGGDCEAFAEEKISGGCEGQNGSSVRDVDVEDNQKLAEIIKLHHQELRVAFEREKNRLVEEERLKDGEGGGEKEMCWVDLEKKALEKVWDGILEQDEKLKSYSNAMNKLAKGFWNNRHTNDRVIWCKKTAVDYFKEGGIQVCLEKDQRREAFMSNPSTSPSSSVKVYESPHGKNNQKISLLDVGSCFNPFEILCSEDFDVFALDLQPAVPSVRKADFLQVEVTRSVSNQPMSVHNRIEKQNNADQFEALKFRAESFDVVVFSLLLSYFPSPLQRWQACAKAHELLQVNGLLLVVSPDSNNVNKNAPVMKDWKLGIENLGFLRLKYVKHEHLHLMAFRKVPDRVYSFAVRNSEKILSSLKEVGVVKELTGSSQTGEVEEAEDGNIARGCCRGSGDAVEIELRSLKCARLMRIPQDTKKQLSGDRSRKSKSGKRGEQEGGPSADKKRKIE